MPEINDIAQAERRIRKLTPEKVELNNREVEVGFLTWDELEQFEPILKAIAEHGQKAGFSLLRDAREVVSGLVLACVQPLTAVELGALGPMQVWDLLVIIAAVNVQVDLNSFFTDGGLSEIVGAVAGLLIPQSATSSSDSSAESLALPGTE